MARKKRGDGLTARQRQSQQIMRDKAAMKKRKNMLRWLRLSALGICTVILLGGSIWGWKQRLIGRGIDMATDAFYGLTVRSGFAVQALYLEGRNRTSMEDVEKALGVKKGDPILRLSIDDARARLEQIESVRFAAVERELPGALYVRIIEREPVALWQHQGKLSLVDDNGIVMSGIDIAPYRRLPLIVGDDAPGHVAELMEILALAPDLAKRFSSAIRVGGRRWNIRLEGDVEVRLPENEPENAWKRVSDLQSKQQLLDRDVKVIDLRLPDRLFIKLLPDAMPKKSGNARET